MQILKITTEKIFHINKPFNSIFVISRFVDHPNLKKTFTCTTNVDDKCITELHVFMYINPFTYSGNYCTTCFNK